jgi:hypothetical protein
LRGRNAERYAQQRDDDEAAAEADQRAEDARDDADQEEGERPERCQLWTRPM